MNAEQKEILRTVGSMNSIYPDIEWKPVSGKKTIEEHVADAKRLTKEHDGILPNPRWLRENGYAGLYQCMKRCPEPFKNIPQDIKRGKSLEEWIIIAEKLAKENDGILPSPKWLIKNGYNGLYQCLRKHPEKFKHIPQYKIGRTDKECIDIAERLAKEHGGILPSTSWLQKNGYVYIYIRMKKHPELFSHIKQINRRGKALEDHVAEARRLATEHGEILPSPSRLNKNGHSGLVYCMKRFPEPFKDIPQNRRTKTEYEHIADAERLTKENGGILPAPSWLRKNGYHSLDLYMRNHPEPFLHIKQTLKRKAARVTS